MNVSTVRLTRLLSCFIVAWLAVQPTWIYAGHQLNRGNAVGGISIDVAGVVGQPNNDALKLLLNELRKEVQKAPGEMNVPAELRMVSLRSLERACQEALQNNLGKLPEEVRYLAGLQRIQYILVYPETNDIVLAGPAEGWKVDDRGYIVGNTTGRPVLLLDDLLVALRTAEKARTEGISCSINPTEEGNLKLMSLLDSYQRNRAVPPENAMKQAFGPQQVLITGVSPTTHFARVLVAADYRMKRIAMELEQSPVKGLPSYVDMIKNNRVNKGSNVNPRWWLTCNYEPLAKSDDGLAWEIRGPGVKAMTEENFVNAEGKTVSTGKTSPAAQKWADLMTAKYEELSVKDPIFGELRNLMDMCVVAAVIQRERLMDKADLKLPLIAGDASELRAEKWNAAKSIPPQFSFVKTSSGVVITASGGVQVNSWEVANSAELTPHVTEIRTNSAAQSGTTSFWW